MAGEQREHHPIRGGRVTRTAPLVGLAGRTAGEAVVNSLRKKIRGGDSAEFHTKEAARYAERLGRSKGVLMKAGQILSFVTLGTVVDAEYQPIYHRALARLLDDAPPMPPALAAEMIATELGVPPSELFAEFDPVPLAAASIGQVHAAVLKDGRRVAVKVQYPGVEKAIRADLANTELLATFFQLMNSMAPSRSNLDMRALAREVAERIGEEINYLTEAANQTAFADAYRGHPFIRIPEVVPELSARRVLTMELGEGMRWSDALKAGQELKDQWGEVIYRFAYGSVRTFGLFHGDLHPGNYLFHPDGGVTFLDFGCVKRYTREQVADLQGLVNACIGGDADEAFSWFVKGGFVNEADAPDPAAALARQRDALTPCIAPQPFTYTPEFAAGMVQRGFSPSGPYRDFTRKVTMPPAYLLTSRMDLTLPAVLGTLGSTGPWNAIREEWDCAGPPATRYGELDLAFREGSHAH
jgi:predicted unusual protein kinase regulating ubiquinone biosynthesis (AarF/ABC1/UbiB family)